MKKRNILGDLYGGLTGAIIALPVSVAYGFIAFAPLGPEWRAVGAMTGLFSSLAMTLVNGILGKTQIGLAGPRPQASFVVAGLIAFMMASNDFSNGGELQVPRILGVVFITIFLSGFIQLLFGIFRAGVMLKFVAYPVSSGLTCAASLLLIFGQLPGAFALVPGHWNLMTVVTGDFSWPTLCVSVATIIVIVWAGKHLPRVPGALLGLVTGSFVHWVLFYSGYADWLGPTIGHLPSQVAHMEGLRLAYDAIGSTDLLTFRHQIFTSALTIAVLECMGTLMAVSHIQDMSGIRVRANREILVQGSGSLFSAVLGGLPGSLYIERSVANFQAGGHSRWSAIVSCVTLALFVFALSNQIAYIPIAAISGVIIVLGWTMFDRWMLRVTSRLMTGRVTNKAEEIRGLCIVLGVMLSSLYFGFVTGVALGIVVSIVVFIAQMSRSIIRRVYFADKVQSKYQRWHNHEKMLREHRKCIAIFELEGALFFGSSDMLIERLEALTSGGILYFVLDFRRVLHLDATGGRRLAQTIDRFAEKGIEIEFAYLLPGHPVWTTAADLGLVTARPKIRAHVDVSLAIEACETDLLNRLLSQSERALPEEQTLQEVLASHGMSAGVIEKIAPFFEPVRVRQGDAIWKKGEESDAVAINVSGFIDIILPGVEHIRRLATLGPGALIGEMAFIDGGVRSADVIARTDVKIFYLSKAAYDELAKRHQDLALAFVVAIAQEMSKRMRQAQMTISELEV